MKHPASIVWFSRFYLASLGLKVAAAILNWQQRSASGTIQIGIIVALLLWFGVMYRHSVVSRVIIVLLFVGGAIWGGYLLFGGKLDPPAIALGGGATLLYALAVWQVWRPASEPWFAASRSG